MPTESPVGGKRAGKVVPVGTHGEVMPRGCLISD